MQYLKGCLKKLQPLAAAWRLHLNSWTTTMQRLTLEASPLKDQDREQQVTIKKHVKEQGTKSLGFSTKGTLQQLQLNLLIIANKERIMSEVLPSINLEGYKKVQAHLSLDLKVRVLVLSLVPSGNGLDALHKHDDGASFQASNYNPSLCPCCRWVNGGGKEC